MPSCERVELFDFRQYVYYIALDCISCGKYKQVFESGCISKQEWALQMKSSRDRIVCVRDRLLDMVLHLDADQHPNVVIAITCVVNNNQPPCVQVVSGESCLLSNESLHSKCALAAHWHL